MRRLRIALVVSNLRSLHGVATYYNHVLPYLREDLEVVVVSTDAAASACDVPIRGWGWRAPSWTPEVDWLIPFHGDINAALRAARPDAVHVTDVSPLSLLALREARRLGVISGLTYHTDLVGFIKTIYRNKAAATAARLFAATTHRRASAIAAMGDTGAKITAASLGIPLSEVRVLRPGVDLGLFSPLDSSMVKTAGPRRLLTVSRLSAEKRIDLLIEAYRAVCQSFDVDLTITGRGPSQDSLRAQAGEGIRFTGAITGEELASLYRASDIFILSSPAEMFPQVLLEAQASGLPCIVSPSGGARQAIDASTGLVAKATSADAFRSAIEGLLRDSEQLRSMQIAARSRASEFTWQLAAHDLSVWYHDLYGRAVGTPRPCRSHGARQLAKSALSRRSH